LKRDSEAMFAAGQVASILAVVQQRLLPSKMNDAWGFELLNAVVQYVKPSDLRQYFKAVIMSLLTRMQANKTDNYVYLFARFILFTMALKVDGLDPDYSVNTIEEIQPGLWNQILTNFVNPQVPKMPHKDRKVAAIGLINLLTQSQMMRREPTIQSWPNTFIALAKLFSEPQHLTSSQKEKDTDPLSMTEIDYEEQTVGYQAAYSRLAASESGEPDPVAYIHDPQGYAGQSLAEFGKVVGDRQLKAMVAAAVQGSATSGDSVSVEVFVRSLGVTSLVS